MQDPLPDNIVIMSLIGVLIVVFTLIYSFRPQQKELQPSIQWRDTPIIYSETLKT